MIGGMKRGSFNVALEGALSGSNVERAGDHNQRAVLQGIRIGGPITRAELVAITGLTTPAIANITKRLQDLDLISEFGLRVGGRGQPAMRLAVNADGAFAIGASVDRDHLALVLLDLKGRIRHRIVQEIRFPTPRQAQSFFRKAHDALRTEHPAAAARLVGIGLTIPGQFARPLESGLPSGFAAWAQTDPRTLFALPDRLPFIVENDASAAAFGEAQLGYGLREPSFLYVLINYGLGGGLVVDGSFVRGANGRGGEIGFLRMPDGHSLEQICSLSALYRRLRDAGHPVETPIGFGLLEGPGQAVLSHWLDDAADSLTEMLVTFNCLVDPDMVFLGGRLPVGLIDTLARLLTQRLNLKTAGSLAGTGIRMAPVRRAAMAMDAPAIGAALLTFSDRLLPSRSALMKPVA